MQQKINNFLSKNQVWIALVIVGVLGRLVPHIPNVTPLISLSLFAGASLSSRVVFLSLFGTLFVSDLGLALLLGYPVFGYWTLFTYTGFMAVVLVGSRMQCLWKTLPVYILSSSFGFWGWTNFGVWLASDLYTKTLVGLGTCYVAALPFLCNSLLGDLIWGLAIFGAFNLYPALINISLVLKHNCNR
ncbi:conserved membrane hypothetical protein [Gammaproteobacteria bacterium]